MRPMHEEQYLLTCLAEEGVEVAQRCTKALRFGIGEVQPGQDRDNYMRLWGEITDFQAVAEMLSEKMGRGHTVREEIEAKKARVRQFMMYSRDLGTLR